VDIKNLEKINLQVRSTSWLRTKQSINRLRASLYKGLMNGHAILLEVVSNK